MKRFLWLALALPLAGQAGAEPRGAVDPENHGGKFGETREDDPFRAPVRHPGIRGAQAGIGKRPLFELARFVLPRGANGLASFHAAPSGLRHGLRRGGIDRGEFLCQEWEHSIQENLCRSNSNSRNSPRRLS